MFCRKSCKQLGLKFNCNGRISTDDLLLKFDLMQLSLSNVDLSGQSNDDRLNSAPEALECPWPCGSWWFWSTAVLGNQSVFPSKS